MNTKKWLLGGLASLIVMLVLSFLWYQVIMGGFYKEKTADVARVQMETTHWLALVLGYLFLAFLMSYIYPIGYKGGSPAKEGLRFGIIVGLLVWLCANVILFAVYKLLLVGIVVDILYHVVEQGVGGIVIAFIYGKGPAAKAVPPPPSA